MITTIARPGPLHEERVRTLEALATLAGFLTEIPVLPDGRMPDVVRMCTRRRGLFLGEAKASESPGDQAALARLFRYVAWWQRVGRRGPALLVVCCGMQDSGRWASSLTALVTEAGSSALANMESLGEDDALVWLATSPDGQMSAKNNSNIAGWGHDRRCGPNPGH
jgi:hypothetical protein